MKKCGAEELKGCQAYFWLRRMPCSEESNKIEDRVCVCVCFRCWQVSWKYFDSLQSKTVYDWLGVGGRLAATWLATWLPRCLSWLGYLCGWLAVRWLAAAGWLPG